MSRIRATFTLATILVLLIGFSLPYNLQPVAAADSEEQNLPPIASDKKGNPKLDSRLNQMVANTAGAPAGFTLESANKSDEKKVRVIIESMPGKSADALKAADLHGVVETTYDNLLQMMVPVARLNALADNPNIRLVRAPMEALFSAVTSEGVALVNADDWQTAGYNGSGIKVGIIDGGFSGYASLLGTELPPTVTTRWATSIGDAGSSDHGTACAEIVYDVAPGAQFYLANFGTTVELGNAVDWMIAQGVDVISASWGYPAGGPGDGTGPITSIVDTARAAGILWVNAAGNSAQKHWQGNFSNGDSNSWHNFSGADELNDITVINGATIVAALKWDDPWGASGNDYDLLLYDNTFTLVALSANIQDGNDDPVEIFGYTATYSGTYYIAIGILGSPAVRNLHLYSCNHILECGYPPATASSWLTMA